VWCRSNKILADDRETASSYTPLTALATVIDHLAILQEPFLVCGTHELKGTVEMLKQPFAVLQKRTLGNGSGKHVSYHVKGVVTRRLLFNRYPKTIMR
jgi:hypothetical protein